MHAIWTTAVVRSSTVFCGLALSVGAGSLAACVSGFSGVPDDAGADAADAGTAELDAAPVTDAAPPKDASTSTVTGVYSTVLLSQLAFGDPAKSFKLYTRLSYDSAARVITTIDLTPIKASATKVSKTEIVGTIVSRSAVKVSAKGRFELPLGSLTIPGEANPITGRDIVIDNATLIGRFAAPGGFCSQLTGTVVSPITLVLEQEKNNALHAPANEGDPFPVRAVEDFQCTIPAD